MPDIATAYLVPPRSACRTGPPGMKLYFRAGALAVRDERQVSSVLRMADVVFTPTARYADHVAGWIAACGEARPAQARIALPSGEMLEPPGYHSLEAFEASLDATPSDADAAGEPPDPAPACPRCVSGNLKGNPLRRHQFKAHGLIG